MFNVGDKIVYPMHGAGTNHRFHRGKRYFRAKTILLHTKDARRGEGNDTNSEGRRSRSKKYYK